MAGSIREKDFLNDGGDSKRKLSKVVKPVRSRTLSSKDVSASPSVNDVAHGVASITQKAQEFVSSTYYKKEDFIVFDSDDEEDAPREPMPGKEATKSLAELEQLFFRCANVMKAEDIHLQMRNLHMIMAKQILKDMEIQIKYDEKKRASREMWDFKQKVHMATFKRIAKPIEKSVDKKKKEKDNRFFVPRWMPDERRQRCLLCKRPFGVFNRRHHCRACGDITCNDCSKMEGPHRIRRCNECIRLNRTVATSMPPAKSSPPPTPASFSTIAGPSHPSHKRTTYIHQSNSPATMTSSSSSSSSSSSNSSISSSDTMGTPRDLGGRAVSLPPPPRTVRPPTRGTPMTNNGTSSSKIVVPSRERESFASASLAGPQNTTFSVPVAWGETSHSRTRDSSGSGSQSGRRSSSSSTSPQKKVGENHSPPPPTMTSSSSAATTTTTTTTTAETSSTPSSSSVTVSVTTTCNGTGGMSGGLGGGGRLHSQSVSVSVVNPVPWVPDEHRLCCVICGCTFHFFFRRHHCRKCGEVVCNTCSTIETLNGERYCSDCQQVTEITI